MIARQDSGNVCSADKLARRAATPLWCLLLCLTSCLTRSPGARFRVLPKSPNYLLQSPDSRQTPFPDVLRAYNGFEAGHGWIDLHPLMELRIENAYYEAGAPRSGLKGFLGTEIARYRVLPGGLRLVSVQPMKNRPPNDKPVQDLIPDLEKRFTHYRFYYEMVFARSDHSRGSVLLGADSREELDGLAMKLANQETVCNPQSTHCVVFPEACSVSVEMEIIVNGRPQMVTWGSILGSIAQDPRNLQVRRLYAGRLRPIEIDPHDPKALRLPLLPGDRIVWK